MYDENFNEIMLSGVINNITETKDYTLFGLIAGRYASDGALLKVYINLSIYKDLYYKYKDLFYKGNKIFIKGYLNSYLDSNKNYKVTVTVIDVFKTKDELLKGKPYPYIRYDPDGVMVWNGKRCESIPATPEEQKEMEELLKEFYWKECDIYTEKIKCIISWT